MIIPIVSLQCSLGFYTQLYYVNLVFIITISVLLSLYYLLSALLTHSCIHCLVYMTMLTYGCYVSLVFDVAIPIVSYYYLVT